MLRILAGGTVLTERWCCEAAGERRPKKFAVFAGGFPYSEAR